MGEVQTSDEKVWVNGALIRVLRNVALDWRAIKLPELVKPAGFGHRLWQLIEQRDWTTRWHVTGIARALGEGVTVEDLILADGPAPTDEQVIADLTRASKVVDEPGKAVDGVVLAKRVLQTIAGKRKLSPLGRALLLQLLMSAANHAGDGLAFERYWKTFLEAEKGWRTLDPIRIMIECSNRRAVALVDRFKFAEAATLLGEFIDRAERLAAGAAAALGVAVSGVDVPELPPLFGSLGLALALQGKAAEAGAAFRRAAALFGAGKDGRQWVALGHLACDMKRDADAMNDETAAERNTARAAHAAADGLWAEVCGRVRGLNEKAPIMAAGRQFELALQVKGLLCFGDAEGAKAFLAEWRKADDEDPFRKADAKEELWQSRKAYGDDRRAHPFDLIYQGVGALYDRAYHARVKGEVGLEEAKRGAGRCFDLAAEVLEGGGLTPYTRTFASVARVRKLLAMCRRSKLGGEVMALHEELAVLRQRLRSEYTGAEAPWVREFVGRDLRRPPEVGGGWESEGTNAEWELEVIGAGKGVVGGIRFNQW